MQIDGLYWIAGQEVNAVEHLGETNEVLVVGVVAGASALIHVECVWCAGYRAERHVVAADNEVVRRVAAVERERRRRGLDLFEHHLAVEPNSSATGLNAGTSVGQQLTSIGVEKVHADLFENLHRRVVNHLEFVG